MMQQEDIYSGTYTIQNYKHLTYSICLINDHIPLLRPDSPGYLFKIVHFSHLFFTSPYSVRSYTEYPSAYKHVLYRNTSVCTVDVCIWKKISGYNRNLNTL